MTGRPAARGSASRDASAALLAASRLFKAEHKGRAAGRVFALALFGLFVACILMALVAGVGSYRSVQARGASADRQRLASALVSNAVMANDASLAVSSEPGPEGPALVLTQRTPEAAWCTWLYLYRGHLMQEFAMEGAHPSPERAVAVLPAQSFAFAVQDGLLTVETDQTAAEVALRSSEPLAAEGLDSASAAALHAQDAQEGGGADGDA